MLHFRYWNRLPIPYKFYMSIKNKTNNHVPIQSCWPQMFIPRKHVLAVVRLTEVVPNYWFCSPWTHKGGNYKWRNLHLIFNFFLSEGLLQPKKSQTCYIFKDKLALLILLYPCLSSAGIQQYATTSGSMPCYRLVNPIPTPSELLWAQLLTLL